MAGRAGPSPAWLAAVALGAALLHQLYWLLPLALMLGLPALWFGQPVLVGLALVAFLGLAWIFQPRAPLPPQRLAVQDAPRLYERVHALADALQAPRVHAIALDDELNAGALELNRGVSLRPVRRVLVIGRPLLAALDAQAVEAVIAHELGHFSRQHGRLGHWLYRTRQSWATLRDLQDEPGADRDSSAWDRAASGFAHRFLPWFDRISHAHLRRCEFEADALAARVVQPQALARALVQLHQLQDGVMRVGASTVRQQMLRHAQRPADLLDREVAAWRESVQARGAVETSPPDDDDTHPPLDERLAALGIATVDAAWPSRSAGLSWWGGESWPAVASGPGDEAQRLRWRMAHRLLQGVLPAAAGTPERRAQRAWIRGELPSDGELGDTPAALLIRARIALHEGDRAAARQLLLACRALKTAERDDATRLLMQHRLAEDATQQRQHAAWWQAVQARRAAAFESMETARLRGRIEPSPLEADEQAALRAALGEHPDILEVDLLGQSMQVQGVDYRMVVLLLRIASQADEDAVADAAQSLLAWVGDAALLRVVQVRYADEALAPALAEALRALQAGPVLA